MAFTPNPETARLYKTGLTLDQVGRALGLNDRTVSRHLKALGVKPRPGGNPNTGPRSNVQVDWDQIEHDYVHGGASTIALEERYGVHRSTINRHMRTRGVSRTREEANNLRRVRKQRRTGDLNALAADLAMDPQHIAQLLRTHGFITE